MDLSAKLLREVEFRTSLRGYDTDEVDEFLEKVAVAVDETLEKLRQLTYRAERAERSISDRAADGDDDSIRRTLVLAQRTADLAVREAQEQAAVLMDAARSESDKLLDDARQEAQRLASEAAHRHADDIARLQRDRDHVSGELKELSELLEKERKRLEESLRAALRLVEKTLTPSKEISKLRPAPAPSEGNAPDDIEAQIDEDAAAAAPSVLPDGDDYDGDAAEGEDGRANLAAVPPIEDSGPITETWQAEPMTIFNHGDDNPSGPRADPGPHDFGASGSDWIA
jgi:cell division initiation protein